MNTVIDTDAGYPMLRSGCPETIPERRADRHGGRDAPNAAAAVRQALALLACASNDWRQCGPSDGSAPLYWPAAIGAAKAHLAYALAELGDPAVLDALAAQMRDHRPALQAARR